MFCGKVEMLGVFVVPGRFVVPDMLNGFPKGGRGALATFPILGDVWGTEGNVDFADVWGTEGNVDFTDV